MIWDNRAYKSFKPEVARYFRLLRHYRNICYCFSQNFDIDKKLRDLCDQLFLCTNIFGFLSVARKIRKSPTLHQPSTDRDSGSSQEGFITEDFSFYPPSQWIWTYIPRYIKFFNSFELDPMPLAPRAKYKFIDEPYLYKLTHYAYYKKDQLDDLYKSFKRRQHINKYAFDIDDDLFIRSVWCSGFYPSRCHMKKGRGSK